MARIFITGSADGLGLLAAEKLIDQGHKVVLHARNADRRKQTLLKVPGAEEVLIADLSDTDETVKLSEEINALGKFDAVIHNAGVYRGSEDKIFTVNTLAPYILTCLINKPERLIYLSSGMHLHGNPDLRESDFISGNITYSDSKLHDVILCMAAARKWPDVYANSVNPGWVPTNMGGTNATDDLQQGAETQVWLAVSEDEKAKVSGRYFFHKKEERFRPEAVDTELQERFLALCEQISGVRFPGGQK